MEFKSLIIVYIIVLLFETVHSETSKTDKKFEVLLRRIEALEAHNARIGDIESKLEVQKSEHELEISGLKNRINEMKMEYGRKEASLVERMTTLESELEMRTPKLETHDDGIHGAGQDSSVFNGTSQRGITRILKTRGVPEVEVAFYATNQAHDVRQLQINQAIPFPLVVTNVGNATGPFVAPVTGTYVIHGTIMG
ncbi:hypothetical protein ACF0H5_010675 [Mactra antiquata]